MRCYKDRAFCIESSYWFVDRCARTLCPNHIGEDETPYNIPICLEDRTAFFCSRDEDESDFPS